MYIIIVCHWWKPGRRRRSHPFLSFTTVHFPPFHEATRLKLARRSGSALNSPSRAQDKTAFGPFQADKVRTHLVSITMDNDNKLLLNIRQVAAKYCGWIAYPPPPESARYTSPLFRSLRPDPSTSGCNELLALLLVRWQSEKGKYGNGTQWKQEA